MFRFLGSVKSHAVEERHNTSRQSETARGRQPEVSGISHGPTHRPVHMQPQQQQQQLQNNENMVTLHARLLQEAEKIRKWKVQTELDLKEKERKLAEASLRIETMKKSILELQLENEKTSARLDEEIGSKGEVLKRINATREMCNLLKSHASSVLDRLTRCETEKTELKYTNKEHMQQLQDLTSKFKNLQIQVVESEKRTQDEAEIKRLDQVQKEETLKLNLNTSQKEIQNLNEVLSLKNNEIQNLEAQLQSSVTRIEALEVSSDALQKNMSCLSKELETRESELRESALRIASIQDEKSNLEKKLQGLEADFSRIQASKDDLSLQMTEATTKLEEKLKLAQEDGFAVKNQLNEEQEKLLHCENQLLETNQALENLKSARDALLIEKKEVEMNEDMLKFQISNLNAEKEETKEEIHNLSGEISELNKKLDRESLCRSQAQNEAEILQGKIAALELDIHEKTEYASSIESEVSALKAKTQSLETLLSESEDKAIKLQANVEDLESTIDSERQKIHQLHNQIEEAKQEISSKSETLKEKEDSLKKALETLEATGTTKTGLEQELSLSHVKIEELRSKLCGEEQKTEELTSQLNELTEERKQSGKNLTSQQKKADATAKANKELEKEVKSLKTNFDKELKASKKQADELAALKTEMTALKKAKVDTEKAVKKYEEEMKQLRQQCEKDQKEAKLAMEKAMDMQKTAEREKENAQALTDCQLSEMMSTLETYKQNNEKLISEKDLEIEALRKQIQDKKWADMKHNDEKGELSHELDVLKKRIATLEKEKQDLASQVTAALAEKDKLKEQATSLEDQVSRLKLQADQSREVKHTPLIKSVGHQSPPVVQVTPQKQAPRTPVPTTPKISTAPKTPSRSILRVVNSETKRRKVAFAHNSPSSSEESDLMELDPEAALNSNSCTPLLFTPKATTPRAERSVLSDAKLATSRTVTVPLNRKPRGPPVKQDTEDVKTPKVRKTPMKKPEPQTPESLQGNPTRDFSKASHIRKTPAKKTSKFFSVSPRNKAGQSRSKGKDQAQGGASKDGQMAWFDLDSVYGFGPED